MRLKALAEIYTIHSFAQLTSTNTDRGTVRGAATTVREGAPSSAGKSWRGGVGPLGCKEELQE